MGAIAASGHGTAIGLPLALAFIGVGLFCVWMEIGRPLRALNVFFHARTSWMTREAIVAGRSSCAASSRLLSGWLFFAWLAALIGLVFLYCQARILQAAAASRPAREPTLLPLIVVTGLSPGLACSLALPRCPLAWRRVRLPAAGVIVLASGCRGAPRPSARPKQRP